MHVHTKRTRWTRRLPTFVVSALVLALVSSVQVASGTTSASAKPVIGKPKAVPAQPVAGKPFTVSFKVTRSDTGKPLTRGTMICDPSVAGKVIAHAESFTRGNARLAFVVPAGSGQKVLKVKVTIRSAIGSATRVTTFAISDSRPPAVSISGASAAEGNTGKTTLTFPVTLSVAATQPVTVGYATANGTAVAPSDYVAASGKLEFARGERAKTIVIDVVPDLNVEQDETFTVALSNPVNATIGTGTATGTITNDDTAVPVTAGSYKGQTQNGNYVFFVVTGNRTITGFRVNDLPCTCSPYGELGGGEDFGDSTFTIRPDGSFAAQGSWTGSQIQGDIEWLHWDGKVTGLFSNATSVTGTILMNYELKYQGTHFTCSSAEIKWSATLQS